jgi:hypothetical protein
MEYLKNHFKITDTEYKKIISISINSLKSDSDKGISADKAIDNIRHYIHRELIETNFIFKYNQHFEEIYRIYNLSFSNYDSKKVDVIKSVLINETHDQFEKRLKIEKIPNFTYGEDFDNITYEDFVEHLLKYDVYQKCYNRLLDNIEFYKLLFEVSDFKFFTFNKFEGHVFDSTLYKNIFSKYYPNEPIPIAIYKQKEFGGGYYEIIRPIDKDNIPINQKLKNISDSLIHQTGFTNTEKNIIQSSIDQLSIKERSFLFYVMCQALNDGLNQNNSEAKNTEKSFNLPATELCRLVSIVSIKDFNSFDKNKYRDTVQYKVLIKGIYFFEKDERINFIETLIKKIKYLNLSETTKYIKSILNKQYIKLSNQKNEQKMTK